MENCTVKVNPVSPAKKTDRRVSPIYENGHFQMSYFPMENCTVKVNPSSLPPEKKMEFNIEQTRTTMLFRHLSGRNKTISYLKIGHHQVEENV